jgi:hypothetical protein
MNKDEIENIKWMKRSRGYGLKFITKNDTSLRYDGFKDTVCVLLIEKKTTMLEFVFFSL